MALIVTALLERGDDAIDVGAAEGHLMQQIVAAAPEGRHLAVEPAPDHALQLRSELPDNVIVEEYALTDDELEGEMEFLHVPRPVAFMGARPIDYPASDPISFRRLQVRTIALDALVERHGLMPRLIRIDVDGAEGSVLQGAVRTIEAFRPALLVEHGNSCAHGGMGQSSMAFFEQASDFGLRIFDLDGRGPYDANGFQLAVRGRGIVNYLLRP